MQSDLEFNEQFVLFPFCRFASRLLSFRLSQFSPLSTHQDQKNFRLLRLNFSILPQRMHDDRIVKSFSASNLVKSFSHFNFLFRSSFPCH